MTPRRRRAVGHVPQNTQTTILGRKHRPDYKIILYAGLLVLIGLVVLFAISPYQIHQLNASGADVDQNHYMFKQTTYLAIGAAAFATAASVPFEWWRRYAARILLAGIGACLILALLGLGSIPPAMCYNGACRWFDFGVTSFQPAELLKFGAVVFMAIFLGRRMQAGTLNTISESLVPVGIVVGLTAVIVIGFQKDMGTGITIIAPILTMLFVAGLNRRNSGLIIGGALLAGLLFIVISPHRLERVTTFVNASGSSDAASYHIDMAKLAIGSGGFFGRGLGNGVQAFGYLPEALNDSIFAVLGETFGFVGLLIVLGLFVALLRRMIAMIGNLIDPTMQLLVAGVFGWLSTHVIINIGAMTGLLPLTGVTLPFLSFGGSSLLFIMASLGMVYHISQYTSHQQQPERGQGHESTRSRGRFGRSRHASSGSNK